MSWSDARSVLTSGLLVHSQTIPKAVDVDKHRGRATLFGGLRFERESADTGKAAGEAAACASAPRWRLLRAS